MRRRVVLLLTSMALAVLLTSGASWAQTEPVGTPAKKCNGEPSTSAYSVQDLRLAQPFRSTMAGKLTTVQAPVTGDPGSVMQIVPWNPPFADDYVFPVLASAEIPSVETRWKTFVFDNASAASVVEGQRYAIMLKPPPPSGAPGEESRSVRWIEVAGTVPDPQCGPGYALAKERWVGGGATGFGPTYWDFLFDREGLFATYVTEPDTTTPSVSSVAPRDGARGVALDGNVEANFSEAMDASTITDSTFTLILDGTPVSATVSYDPTTKKATLNPNTVLQAGKTYTAKIKSGSAGVKDSSGNALNTDEVWSFTTLDTTPPRVTSTVPSANATGVAPTVNGKATFSEHMTASTINKTTFTLRKQGSTGLVAATVTYDSSTDTATLDPTNSLREGPPTRRP